MLYSSWIFLGTNVQCRRTSLRSGRYLRGSADWGWWLYFEQNCKTSHKLCIIIEKFGFSFPWYLLSSCVEVSANQVQIFLYKFITEFVLKEYDILQNFTLLKSWEVSCVIFFLIFCMILLRASLGFFSCWCLFYFCCSV